jgi:vacuolar protein sorting-associated protein 3
MFSLLNEKRDKTLAQQWGIWLLKYDQDKAMRVSESAIHGVTRHADLRFSQLLLTIGLGKRTTKGQVEESALLRRIQEADPAAGAQFLENLVLNKRNAVRTICSNENPSEESRLL